MNPFNTVDAEPVPKALLQSLEPQLQEILGVVRELDPHAHLVGGFVRDLLLQRPSRDLDVISETPARVLGAALQTRLGGTLTCHARFLTCTLALPGLELDLATARTESYLRPGALPEVTPATLAADLYRRDFSVNTFALSLTDPGTLLSVPGAREDLAGRALRVLHDRSFFDDPTRIVRGARLAGRLEFRYNAETESALAAALTAKIYKQVSAARLKNELWLTLAEPEVAPALAQLEVSGALQALYGFRTTSLFGRLDALKAKTPVSSESYLLALLLELSATEAAHHVTIFGFPKRLLRARARVLEGAPEQTEAEWLVRRAQGPEQNAPSYPLVRGSDVLSLGLSAGPEVGGVLARLEQARLDAQVASFADELALARRLVEAILERE